MASNQKTLKKVIKSVGSTRKITKTMQLISSAKLQKTLKVTKTLNEYATTLKQIVSELGGLESSATFDQESNQKTLVVVLASDRGMCGSYNTQVGIAAAEYIKQNQDQIEYAVLGSGKRSGLAAKLSGKELVGIYPSNQVSLSVSDVKDIKQVITEGYDSGLYTKVVVAYTQYKSALLQVPTLVQLLPFEADNLEIIEDQVKVDYVIEPSKTQVVQSLLPQILELMLYNAFVQSQASEHASRMRAMKQATDNAGDIITNLTLEMNTLRQALITQEIAQIVGATNN
jgi:F-type H+-transporting ATPase subunit gamma